MTNKFLKFIVILGFIFSIIALSAAMINISSNNCGDRVNELYRSDWDFGDINDKGKVIESKESVYTEGIYDIESMEISLDENEANVTYRVVFYDEEKDYISSTGSLEEDFDISTIPTNASYFRVVLTPYEVDGEAVKLTTFNLSKYLKQIVVKY